MELKEKEKDKLEQPPTYEESALLNEGVKKVITVYGSVFGVNFWGQFLGSIFGVNFWVLFGSFLRFFGSILVFILRIDLGSDLGLRF